MAWKLACMLKTYTKYDPTVEFKKYELNNKLLIGVTFFRFEYEFHHIEHITILFNPIDQDLNMNFTKSSGLRTIY